MIWSMTSAARRCARTVRCSICWRRHPHIAKHLNREELAKLCDPANYLGQSGVMVDRVLSRVRDKM